MRADETRPHGTVAWFLLMMKAGWTPFSERRSTPAAPSAAASPSTRAANRQADPPSCVWRLKSTPRRAPARTRAPCVPITGPTSGRRAPSHVMPWAASSQGHAVEERHRAHEDRRPVPGQDVEAGDAEVGPPDQAEDPPPVGPQLDPAGDLRVPVGQGDEEQKSHTRPSEPGPPDPSPAVLRRAPHEQHAERREHVPRGGREHAAHPLLGVHHEDTHDHQGQGPEEDVAPHRAPRLPATQPPAERERNGDTDDEEEGREDEVGDRHPVEVGGPVAQELGRPGDAGDLVHEQHEQDVGTAEQIDREDARSADGGRRSGQVGPPGKSPEGYPGARGHTMR